MSISSSSSAFIAALAVAPVDDAGDWAEYDTADARAEAAVIAALEEETAAGDGGGSDTACAGDGTRSRLDE
jgi:hypothetical protein